MQICFRSHFKSGKKADEVALERARHGDEMDENIDEG